MTYPFYLVDVFAETKYTGNQLAVILKAEELSALEMQNIAREMNYSETTFILSDQMENGGYNVRIFSLDEELPFAGHPTLGTAYIIQQLINAEKMPVIKLNLPVGQITVSFEKDHNNSEIIWMQQVVPVFGQTLAAEEVALVLNLSVEQFDQRYPIGEVSTGLPFIIVPLVNLEAVRACQVDPAAFFRLVRQTEAKSIFVFCPETYNDNNQINARMFDHYHGIAEDPATGSANGCLAAYLVKHHYYGHTQLAIKVEQGYEIGRPSLISLKAEELPGGPISVKVGGKVIMVARGELF